MKLILLALALLLAQRLPPVRSSGGAITGCSPTQEQLDRRSILTSIPAVTPPTLPAYGATTPTCDPAFGSQIVRLDDDSYNLDQIDIAGRLFFNRDETAYITSVASGAQRIYDFNPSTLVPSNARMLGLVQTPEAQQNAPANNMWWDQSTHPDAPTSLYAAIGMRIYLVSTVPNGTAIATSQMVADMSAEYPGGLIFQVMPAASGTRILFVVLDPARGFAKLAWYVVDLLSRTSATPTTNYTVVRKFKNGVDSPNWYDFQTNSGLQFTSTFAHVTTADGVVNGYKPIIDATGQWIVHITNDPTGCTSPSSTGACGATFAPTGPYNTYAIQNVATGQVRWAQGGGHSGAGNEVLYGFNTSGYATCIDRPKAWFFADLTTDPTFTAAANQGRCDLPTLTGGLGYGIQYTNVKGTTAVHVHSCNVGPCATPVPPFQDEMFTVSPAGVVRREAKLYHLRGTGNEYLQPIWARTRNWVAYQSNWGSTNSYIFLLRIVQ